MFNTNILSVAVATSDFGVLRNIFERTQPLLTPASQELLLNTIMEKRRELVDEITLTFGSVKQFEGIPKEYLNEEGEPENPNLLHLGWSGFILPSIVDPFTFVRDMPEDEYDGYLDDLEGGWNSVNVRTHGGSRELYRLGNYRKLKGYNEDFGELFTYKEIIDALVAELVSPSKYYNPFNLSPEEVAAKAETFTPLPEDERRQALSVLNCAVTLCCESAEAGNRGERLTAFMDTLETYVTGEEVPA